MARATYERDAPLDDSRGVDADAGTLADVLRRLRADPRHYASAAALAAASGFGASKLSALARDHYQTTPARLLLRARIDAACRLLAEGTIATSETGFAVGFESLAACERSFERATGLSPRAYRDLPTRADMTLALPAGYCPDALLRVQGRDAQGPCERANGNHVTKAFAAAGNTALLHLHVDGARAHCRVESGVRGKRR